MEAPYATAYGRITHRGRVSCLQEMSNRFSTCFFLFCGEIAKNKHEKIMETNCVNQRKLTEIKANYYGNQSNLMEIKASCTCTCKWRKMQKVKSTFR